MITTFEPIDKLKKYVLHFFILDWKKLDDNNSISQLCLPTGCSFMGFHLKGRMKISIDNLLIETKYNYINAQTTRPYYMIADDDLSAVVICLKPKAIYHLFEADLQPIVDNGGDLYSFFGEHLRDVENSLQSSITAIQKIKILEELLLNQLSKSCPKFNFIDIALDIIIQRRGCVTIKELINILDVSERYFQRQFKLMVGIKPSLYINIIRYNFIFASLNHTDIKDCKTISALFNFYDVPHFSKSFKFLFGKSPSDFDIEKHTFLKFSAVDNSLWLFPFQKSIPLAD